MASISQFLQSSEAIPSKDNQQNLWCCDHQASVGAIIQGLEPYENWTDMPSGEQAMINFADSIEASAQKWDRLSGTELSLLVCVLSSLQLSASYYIMSWLEYCADSQDSTSMTLADTALKMQQSANKTEQLAGKRMWKRISTLVKISSAQGVLADSLKQNIMVD